MRILWPAALLWLLPALSAAPPLAGQERSGPEVPVTGVVLDARSGAGVPAAAIRFRELDGRDSTREVWSERDGRFHLASVPVGRYRLEVSAFSYVDLSESIEILGLGPTDVRIELVPEVLELDPVVVTTTSGGWLQRSGFFERRERGMGTYFSRAEIARYASGPELSDVFRVVPGARVVPPGEFGQTARVELRGGCEPALFVDGSPLMAGTTVDEVLQSFDVEGMEVYRGITVPAQFSGRGSCGAIVVWTREPGRGVGTSALLPTLGKALVGVGTIVAAVVLSF